MSLAKSTETTLCPPMETNSKETLNILSFAHSWFTKQERRRNRQELRENELAETNLNGSNTKTAGLKNKTNTACSDSFSEPANNSTCNQHVLHDLCFTSSGTQGKKKDSLEIFAQKDIQQKANVCSKWRYKHCVWGGQINKARCGKGNKLYLLRRV